jgi:hypothetical protein
MPTSAACLSLKLTVLPLLLSSTPNRQGTYNYPDGSYYTGAWRGGLKHGPGTYWDTAGGCLRGNWERGVLSGQGRYDQPHHHFEGRFVRSVPAGEPSAAACWGRQGRGFGARIHTGISRILFSHLPHFGVCPSPCITLFVILSLSTSSQAPAAFSWPHSAALTWRQPQRASWWQSTAPRCGWRARTPSRQVSGRGCCKRRRWGCPVYGRGRSWEQGLWGIHGWPSEGLQSTEFAGIHKHPSLEPAVPLAFPAQAQRGRQTRAMTAATVRRSCRTPPATRACRGQRPTRCRAALRTCPSRPRPRRHEAASLGPTMYVVAPRHVSCAGCCHSRASESDGHENAAVCFVGFWCGGRPHSTNAMQKQRRQLGQPGTHLPACFDTPGWAPGRPRADVPQCR